MQEKLRKTVLREKRGERVKEVERASN